METFKVGDLVRKVKGYAFDGVVVSVFNNTNGDTRLVVEMVSTDGNGSGMLHIFSPSQLELR